MKKYRFNELSDEAKQSAANNMLINHDVIYEREFINIIEEFVDIIKEKFDVFDEKECYNIDCYENELGCCTNFFNFGHRIFDTNKVSKVLTKDVQPVCIRDELDGNIMMLNQNHRWHYAGNYSDEIKENADIISLDCYGYEDMLNMLFNRSELKTVIIEALRIANARLDELMNEDVDIYDGQEWADEFDAWFDKKRKWGIKIMKYIDKTDFEKALKEEFPQGYSMAGWIYNGWHDVTLYDITNIQHKITMYYKPYGRYYKIQFVNGSTI